MSFLPKPNDLFKKDQLTKEYAIELDKKDRLAHLRELFWIPKVSNREAIYLCGNSLGLLPRSTENMVNEELNVWKSKGVEGHFDHEFGRPWVNIDEHCLEPLAKIIGAHPNEIAVMGSLTNNLHLLMASFYNPTQKKYKILMEAHAFPSDKFALESQIRFHGFDPEEALIIVDSPRNGNGCLDMDNVKSVIDSQGSEIALVMLGGVNYYTGQVMDMPKITDWAHQKGCHVVFDLAHAVGNIPMNLHDWNVDAAAWCTYKYLNSGPGGIAGIFVHSKHDSNSNLKRLTGWWGVDKGSRFEMSHRFNPLIGAAAYQLSNPCVLAVVSLLSSLKIFEKTDMMTLFQKTRRMTAFMRSLIQEFTPRIRILTPIMESGSQLSLQFSSNDLDSIFERLSKAGVICDKRRPDVIRVAVAPLYNSFLDIFEFIEILKTV